MTSVVMSFQPKWCGKILNREKTIEVRTRFPNDLPCEVFMACAKGKPILSDMREYSKELQNLKDELKDNFHLFYDFYDGRPNPLNGLVVGKFTVEKVDVIKNNWSSFRINNDEAYTNEIANQSCLDFTDLKGYLKDKNGLALHISNLEIFDKPKELSEFRNLNGLPLTRAPQSYCFATLYDVILPKEAE